MTNRKLPASPSAGTVQVRWAVAQLWLYAGGQLMHVLGLLWSGGYGVQRKVAGAAANIQGAPAGQ